MTSKCTLLIPKPSGQLLCDGGAIYKRWQPFITISRKNCCYQLFNVVVKLEVFIVFFKLTEIHSTGKTGYKGVCKIDDLIDEDDNFLRLPFITLSSFSFSQKLIAEWRCSERDKKFQS